MSTCIWDSGLSGERTVKRLRLSKALTIPENTTILEACRRMAARRVDALLLTSALYMFFDRMKELYNLRP